MGQISVYGDHDVYVLRAEWSLDDGVCGAIVNEARTMTGVGGVCRNEGTSESPK